ncbi:MAG: hypothetical protein K2M95_02610 [Clostridiales bacterium]|nr:hypothetical protein [Clostridiales bacterium]
MDYEVLAVLSIETKLPFLEKLLDRRIDRAALDMTSPTLSLLEKVQRLGEYKRLAANLAVMAHRIACVLGAEAPFLAAAATSGNAVALESKRGIAAASSARAVLIRLGVKSLDAYRELPLFAAECKRLKRLTAPTPKICPMPMRASYAGA